MTAASFSFVVRVEHKHKEYFDQKDEVNRIKKEIVKAVNKHKNCFIIEEVKE